MQVSLRFADVDDQGISLSFSATSGETSPGLDAESLELQGILSP